MESDLSLAYISTYLDSPGKNKTGFRMVYLGFEQCEKPSGVKNAKNLPRAREMKLTYETSKQLFLFRIYL